jgi:hypothetical protein
MQEKIYNTKNFKQEKMVWKLKWKITKKTFPQMK